MAYSSLKGRKPAERASKISHNEIISNTAVRELLAKCSVPKPPDDSLVTELAHPVPPPTAQRIRVIVAIDGGYRETSVREEFPSASITFFTFGPLLFRLEDLRELDAQPFLAPEDMARLKHIQRYTLALPTRNISRDGRSLRVSVRETLQEFFERKDNTDPALSEALRWILFCGWSNSAEDGVWEIPSCPNYGCDAGPITLRPGTPDRWTCELCGGPLFLIDSLRLHERIDEEQGAAGIAGYVMTTLEQVVLVHVVKALFEAKPAFLSEVLFIKDGPLAFFGQTSPLSKPMRKLAAFLGRQPDPSNPDRDISLLNVAGLEKSGAFVEHAVQIADQLDPGSVLVLTNDYIYRYVVPGDPNNADPYGNNTYWGGKLIFKAPDGNVYVATIPTGPFKPAPAYADFFNITEVLTVLGTLRCSMYDNALIPVALANKLVSLSEFPSSRILESFARDAIGAPGANFHNGRDARG